MAQFKRIRTTDATLNRIQDSIAEAVRLLTGEIFGTPAILLKDQSITTSDSFVQHGLGRIPQGYIVTDRNANATIYTSSTTNNRPKEELILRGSAAVTADLLVF